MYTANQTVLVKCDHFTRWRNICWQNVRLNHLCQRMKRSNIYSFMDIRRSRQHFGPAKRFRQPAYKKWYQQKPGVIPGLALPKTITKHCYLPSPAEASNCPAIKQYKISKCNYCKECCQLRRLICLLGTHSMNLCALLKFYVPDSYQVFLHW